MPVIPGRFQQRRDTAAHWAEVDPILLPGEIGVETNTGKAKIGDGTTAWTGLLYSTDPPAVAAALAKLAGVEAGAEVNPASLAEVPDGVSRIAFTPAERAKLAAVVARASFRPAYDAGPLPPFRGPADRQWALAVNIRCNNGNRYIDARNYSDAQVSALYRELVRHGITWASIRVIWRDSVASTTDLNNRRDDLATPKSPVLHSELLPGLRRMIKWAGVYNVQLMLDFHSLFDSANTWMPQYCYPWSEYADSAISSGSDYYGTSIPIPAGTFRGAVYTGAHGYSYQSIWHPTNTKNRDLLGDFYVAVLNGLVGAEGLGQISLISVINEPFGDWLSDENPTRHFAVYNYLVDRINSVAWAASVVKTARWLAIENPWVTNASRKRLHPGCKTLFGAWCLNMYLYNKQTSDPAQAGEGPWGRSDPFHAAYKAMAEEAALLQKDWFVTEHGPVSGSQLVHHRDYLAYYANDHLHRLACYPRATFLWSADNSGTTADGGWHTDTLGADGQCLTAPGQISNTYKKFWIGIDPVTSVPHPGPGIVPWPDLTVTDAVVQGIRDAGASSEAPAPITRVDRRFANRGVVTLSCTTALSSAERTWGLYPNSLLPGDVLEFRNVGAAITITVQAGMTLTGTASIPAGTTGSPVLRTVRAESATRAEII